MNQEKQQLEAQLADAQATLAATLSTRDAKKKRKPFRSCNSSDSSDDDDASSEEEQRQQKRRKGGKRRIGKRRKQGRPSTRPLSSNSSDEDDGVGNVHKSAYQMAHKHVLEGSQMAHKHVLEGSHQNNLFMIANTALQTKSNKDQIDAIAMLLKSK